MATYNVYLEAYTVISVEADNPNEAKTLAKFESLSERADWQALEAGVVL